MDRSLVIRALHNIEDAKIRMGQMDHPPPAKVVAAGLLLDAAVALMYEAEDDMLKNENG